MAEHTKGPMLIMGATVYALDETGKCNRVTIQVQGGHVNERTREWVSDDERLATAQRLHDCWNALEGYNPDAVRDVVEALRQADAALNSMAALVEAEWRDHDKAMTRHDNDIRAFRELRRAALARLGGAS